MGLPELAGCEVEPQIYVRNTFIEVGSPSPPPVKRSITSPSIYFDALGYDAMNDESTEDVSAAPDVIQLQDEEEVEWGEHQNMSDENSQQGVNSYICVRNTFIEVSPVDQHCRKEARCKTCPAYAITQWDSEEDSYEEEEEDIEGHALNPNCKEKAGQFTLNANAKPFYPEFSCIEYEIDNWNFDSKSPDAIPSSLSQEPSDLMSQLFESLHDACDTTSTVKDKINQKTARRILEVPHNTPAAMYSLEDNASPSNRFAM